MHGEVQVVLKQYEDFFPFSSFFVFNLAITGALASVAVSRILVKTELNFLGFCGSPSHSSVRQCCH